MTLNFRLANVPRFAIERYHPNQVKAYTYLTEISFRVLNLPSVSHFLEGLTSDLGIKGEVDVRVYRVPSAGRKRGGLLGRHTPTTGVITLYPDSLWANPMTSPDDIPGRTALHVFHSND
jgi:hypothetical protein